MRRAFNDQSHLTFENMNDLLLRMSMRRHAAPSRQGSYHLIHRLAMRDCPARDAGTNFNRRIFSFHVTMLFGRIMPSRFFGAIAGATGSATLERLHLSCLRLSPRRWATWCG